ncbi:MAG: hypothetical protein RL318_2966 [Fibrobacterota bacterium]|jgi:DUF1365 family protein
MIHGLASGRVWHQRTSPGRHAFAYRLTYLWCDLDAMDRREMAAPWVGAGSGGVFQVRLEDHLRGDAASWREGIGEWLAKEGLPQSASIHLLTLPRLLGRTFNPVSFWIGQDREGRVEWMVAEVNNTFGARHLYLLDARDREPGRLEWKVSKAFPVSPFHGVDGEYRIALDLTHDSLRLEFDLEHPDGGVFRTGMDLALAPLGTKAIVRSLLRLAGSVVLTVPRILWHAARLHFAAKADLKPRPSARDRWTIHQQSPVLLQRIFANPSLGRIWLQLRRKTSSQTR